MQRQEIALTMLHIARDFVGLENAGHGSTVEVTSRGASESKVPFQDILRSNCATWMWPGGQ
jgi:hypothetical protein